MSNIYIYMYMEIILCIFEEIVCNIHMYVYALHAVGNILMKENLLRKYNIKRDHFQIVI